MFLAAILVTLRISDVLPPRSGPVYGVQNFQTAGSGKVFCDLWLNEAVS
jgi:hypothetical protein